MSPQDKAKIGGKEMPRFTLSLRKRMLRKSDSNRVSFPVAFRNSDKK